MHPFKFITGGYDAIVDKKRRRAPKARTYSEDSHANDRDRRKITATSRDVFRNFTIARWLVGKHLDFVSSFSFQSVTGDQGLDRDIETLIGEWSSRHRCDVARRHPFRRMVRLAEARRVVDGDFGFLKISSTPGSALRGKLQGIEGDRIATPSDLPRQFSRADFINGVRTQKGGAASGYILCDRTGQGGVKFSRIVQASNLLLHGFFDRFDQVRGVSPITSSLNALQDVYEGFDYALAKLKVSQLFGLVTYRSGDQPLGEETDTNDDKLNDEVDFGRGPFQMDLNVDEKAEFLDASTPSTQTTDFLKLMIHVALRSLDVPYSFFDESFTNFYGSRGGLIQYLKSCRNKIADLGELLDEITRWRLGLYVLDGELELPAGVGFNALRWEWVPDGVPWWDPAKEVKGHTMAIAAGLSDFQRVCRESGSDFFANVDRIAEQQSYAAARGVVLNLGMGASNNNTDELEETETSLEVSK